MLMRRVPFVSPVWLPLLDRYGAPHFAFLARKAQLMQHSLLLCDDNVFAGRLAQRFLQLSETPTEWFTVSSDSRESDLKQRRELRKGRVVFEDLPAVRAALSGATLVIEGLERAEPNFLPLLNSLLEQREMNLEDGSLLISHSVFDSLSQSQRRGMLRIHPDFRIICIAKPHAIDPPLRSRLQCRYLNMPEAVYEALLKSYGQEAALKAMFYHEQYRDKPFAVSLAFWVAQSLARNSSENAEDVVKRFVPESAPQRVHTPKSLIPDIVSGKGVLLIGPKASGRRRLLLQTASALEIEVEVLVVDAETTPNELFQTRVGSSERTSWRDSSLTRAMKTGRLCLVDGIQNATQVHCVLAHLLEFGEVTLPNGDLMVSAEKYKLLADEEKEGVHEIHPRFALVAVHDSSRTVWTSTAGPFVFHRFPDQAALADIKEALGNTHVPAGLIDALAKFSSLLAVKSKKISFSIANCLTTLRLCGRLAPLDLVTDALLFDFQSANNKRDIELCIAESGLDKWRTPISGSGSGSGSVTSSSKRVETHVEGLHPALVPNVGHKYAKNQSSEELVRKVSAFIEAGEVALLVGLQGTAKNYIVDLTLERMNLPRAYMQLHRDSSVQSLWTQKTIDEKGHIAYSESPLLEAIRIGKVCILDEIDKANPAVIMSLRPLLSPETCFFRTSDGRVIVSQQLEHLAATDKIVVHPNFRLILLANPGVSPFLGNNVLETLGRYVCAVHFRAPGVDAMVDILASYSKQRVPRHVLMQIAKAFDELSTLVLQGEITYSYGLREAIAVVKDLAELWTNDANAEELVALALANVFDHETDKSTRNKILSVLSKHDLADSKAIVSAFAKGPGNVHENPRTSSFPKAGKDPDGKRHVGGNTWRGGSGGSDTAGLGGKHGPYRYDAGFNVHQLSDEEKSWERHPLKKEAEAAARAMAKAALEEELKKQEIDKDEYDALMRYRNAMASEVEKVKAWVQALSFYERKMLFSQEDGEWDSNRIVETLANDNRVFKRRGQRVRSRSSSSQGKIMLTFLLDLSASMYRFNGLDQRLQRQLECGLLVMEGFADADPAKVQWKIVGFSGDDANIDLVSVDRKPKTLKQEFQVLRKMASHAQFCWSGDTTFEALKLQIEEFRSLSGGAEPDEKHIFLVSDANFRRHNMDPREYVDIVSGARSSGIDVTTIFIGTLGNEAAHLKEIMSRSNTATFVCESVSDLPNVLFQQLGDKLSHRWL